MKLLPKQIFSLEGIETLKITARGGAGNDLLRFLPGGRKINHPLYDFVCSLNGQEYFLELKTQQDTQWFDIGKYFDLKGQENLFMIFALYAKQEEGRKITAILAIEIQEFIDLVTSDRDHMSYGWSHEVMKTGHDYKEKYRALQFKVQAHISKLWIKYPKSFQVIWQKI